MKKVCSRSHGFYKSSDCPVCPTCWPGQQKKLQSDFPKLSTPALRALANANIQTFSDLTNITEKDLAQLHGIGPNAVKSLKSSMKEHKISSKE